MSLECDSKRTFAKVQRTPDGRLLGCCIFLDAAIVGQFADGGADEIEFELIRMPSGIHLEIVGHDQRMG